MKAKSIEAAYAELSPRAFATWVRLMSATADDLSSQKRAAATLRITPRWLRKVLLELEVAGYVIPSRNGAGFDLACVLAVYGRDRVVRL